MGEEFLAISNHFIKPRLVPIESPGRRFKRLRCIEIKMIRYACQLGVSSEESVLFVPKTNTPHFSTVATTNPSRHPRIEPRSTNTQQTGPHSFGASLPETL